MVGRFRGKDAAAVLFIAVAALAVHVLVPYAGAHEGANGVVKQRMDAMDDMSRASKTMTEMFKGQRKYDPDTIARLARNIAEHADKLPEMFPNGSDGHPSETLPSAWMDREGFVKAFSALKIEAAKLGEMATTATQREAMLQFFKMSRTCTACHTDYRKSK